MSADLLRRAAALMRERATAASESPWHHWDAEEWYGGGPAWEVDYVPTDGPCVGEEVQVSGGSTEADAAHIASWHPAVALAVADWLDEVASRLMPDAIPWPHEVAAIVVARAYLGEPS